MTTSYSDTSTSSVGESPTYSAEGYQVWKPEVGVIYKPALPKRHSYGGVIGALQDLQAASDGVVKAYPENFAGIIAAIKDLAITAQDSPGSDTGDKPPGLEIIINPDTGLPDYIYPIPPENGELWFDTRQGRLFVWVEDDWYQTNGADGLPIITQGNLAPEVDAVVPGQFWWDAYDSELYIFDGTIVDDKPVWRLVSGSGSEGSFQTTGTLPLVKATVQPRFEDMSGYIIPIPENLDNMNTQEDYNGWLFQALQALEQEFDEYDPVLIGTDPPPVPREGQLWYDTESLELSIYYIDDDRGQWVPTATAYNYDSDLETITYNISQETRSREAAIHAINERINSINTQDSIDIEAAEQAIIDLQQAVAALPKYDLSLYQEKSEAQITTATLLNRIENIVVPDISHLAVESDVNQELAQLQAQINQLPTEVPDVSAFVTQQHIDQSIGNITVEYLPRAGGTLTGSFVIEKEDVGLPAFDVSSSPAYSADLFKLQSYNSQSKTTTFGATNNWWEVAWNFEGHEDFAWVYNDTDKVFSITKDGPACSRLIIGHFDDNTDQGRQMVGNTIDVGERITKYEQVFANLRNAVLSSTDYASLKSKLLTALTNV